MCMLTLVQGNLENQMYNIGGTHRSVHVKKNKDGYLDFTSCNKFVAKLQIFQDIPVYQEIEKSVDALNTGVCLVVCNNGLTLI